MGDFCKTDNARMGEGLGGRIRLLRLKAELSQPKLAEKLGVSTNTVNRFEKGHRFPDSNIVTRMGEVLSCDLGWLLTGKQDVEKAPFAGIPVLKAWNGRELDFTEANLEGFFNAPDGGHGDVVFRMRGSAMAPRIYEGELLVISQDSNVHEGDAVAFLDMLGGFQIRWLRHVEGKAVYVAENPEYALIPCGDEKILGRVQVTVRVNKL